MIDEIEGLLVHWGEQCRRNGSGGGGVSPLAGLIEWKGAPPRGEAGAVILLGGSGFDHAAAEVDAALGALERAGRLAEEAAERQEGRGVVSAALESQLVSLAYARYRVDPRPSVEEQMRRAMIIGRATYTRRVHELHERVQAELRRRAKVRAP